MSHIIKLGAIAFAKDMCNCPENEMENSKSWCLGFFAGLHEAGMLTDSELDNLNILDKFLIHE